MPKKYPLHIIPSYFSKYPKRQLNIWAIFVSKLVAKNFRQWPNLVTLLPNCPTSCAPHFSRLKRILNCLRSDVSKTTLWLRTVMWCCYCCDTGGVVIIAVMVLLLLLLWLWTVLWCRYCCDGGGGLIMVLLWWCCCYGGVVVVVMVLLLQLWCCCCDGVVVVMVLLLLL